MKIKQDYVLRHMADLWVVVPIGEAGLTRRDIINLNETGAFIWERLEQGSTREKLLTDMLEEYEVSREQAENEIDEFLRSLKQIDVLEDIEG